MLLAMAGLNLFLTRKKLEIWKGTALTSFDENFDCDCFPGWSLKIAETVLMLFEVAKSSKKFGACS